MSDKREVTYNAEQLNQLLPGAKFVRAYADVSEGDDEAFLILVFTKLNGNVVTEFELVVQRDPEGNGSGWIDAYDALKHFTGK